MPLTHNRVLPNHALFQRPRRPVVLLSLHSCHLRHRTLVQCPSWHRHRNRLYCWRTRWRLLPPHHIVCRPEIGIRMGHAHHRDNLFCAMRLCMPSSKDTAQARHEAWHGDRPSRPPRAQLCPHHTCSMDGRVCSIRTLYLSLLVRFICQYRRVALVQIVYLPQRRCHPGTRISRTSRGQIRTVQRDGVHCISLCNHDARIVV